MSPEGGRSRRYFLISPCRDEEKFLPVTIEAVAAQTALPARWLIVDDGSKDGTPAILAAAAARYPFIQVVRRDDRGHRSVGPGVIDALYHGLNGIDLDAYDYFCKFDTDLDVKPRYFERVMEEFERDPRLGNLSGKLFVRIQGQEIPERTGDENAVGAAKFYRVACFREIGGFMREVCWDGIDGHMCRLKGWIASSIDDPELRIVEQRLTGSSHISVWHGRMRWGGGKYFMGSTLYYVAAVAFYRMFERPFFVGGLGILWGYLRARLSGKPRLQDETYLRALRSFERESLLLGKSRALARWNQQVRLAPARA